jgi:hypothetical protein
MKTRSTILSLAALATLSLSALAPTQASAWGYRSMGYGSEPCDPCPKQYAPRFHRHYHAPRFVEELPCEEGAARGYGSRGYGRERMLHGYAPIRQAQGYGQGVGSLQPTQGYTPPQAKYGVPESHGRRDPGQMNRRDSYETPEGEAPSPQANSVQTELER